jgi:hypothetical protein
VPFVHRLALRAGERLGSRHGEYGKVTVGLDDDSGQPEISHSRIGGRTGFRLFRGPPSSAEQRVCENSLDEFLDPRSRRGRRWEWFGPRGGRQNGGLVYGIVQLAEQQGPENRAPRQQSNNDPIHHRCNGNGASLLRKPYTAKAASRRALDGSPVGRTIV